VRLLQALPTARSSLTSSRSPAATLQVTYSILFAPPGQQNNSELVAAHLILQARLPSLSPHEKWLTSPCAQYVVWAFSSVILTAFSLNDIF